MLGTMAGAQGEVKAYKTIEGTSPLQRPGAKRLTLWHGPFTLLVPSEASIPVMIGVR
jgi:hypothetical protein